MKKQYYLGLDIGTNSVGWAVSDNQYKILKFKGQNMWGSRLFEEGSTAEERRLHRSNRRRLQRRKYRLSLLEELFSKEISKVDPGFFLRLKESKYHFEDRSQDNTGCIFNLKDEDKEFFSKYPTIYHLRVALINGEEFDIRLIYIAIHHILKYRGHFLMKGENIDIKGSINEKIDELLTLLISKLTMNNLPLDDNIINAMKALILDKNISSSDKKKQLVDIFISSNKDIKAYKTTLNEVFGLFLGLKCNLKNLFFDMFDFDDIEKKYRSIQFNDSYEEEINNYIDLYGDFFDIINVCKSIYDISNLSKILKSGKNLSESKVASYDKHSYDLALLKKILKNYDNKYSLKKDSSLYNKVFRVDEEKNKNYVNYAGRSTSGKKISKKDFYDFLLNLLENIEDEEFTDDIKKIKSDIEKEDFLPLQRDRINGVIPYQLQLKELKLILEKVSKEHSFLNEVEDGISTSDKIISLLKFRIPYYVGPINNYHSKNGRNGFAWCVKKSNNRVLPWNFEKVIDVEASAEIFIKNMINKCSYLVGCDVLPKNSLIYSEFMLLNEINNLKIDGQKIDIEAKNVLINEVKYKNKKLTVNSIKVILRKEGLINGNENITGIDNFIKADLKSYRDMKSIFGDGFDNSMAEKIILWITLFNGEKKILSEKIRKVYPKIDKNKIEKIINLRYSDWGRLSYEFLTEVKDNTMSQEPINLIQAMREKSLNLMELLSNQYEFIGAINKINQISTSDVEEVSYDLLDDLYVSPAVKRSIWQAIKIVEEVKSIMGYEPNKIFIEMARTNRAEKNRTSSRKNKLIEIYKNIKDSDIQDLMAVLKGIDPLQFRRKKIYLYFLQKGRCMYSGEKIDLNGIFTDSYDIDHIHPRRLRKDDSFNNLVLVKSECNREKSDLYPIKECLKQYNLWNELKAQGLISDEKYNRLVRKDPLTDQELSDFIARQLVETTQSTKAVASLLSQINTSSKLVYVKAEDVTDFRNGRSRKKKDEEVVKFVKCRDINNLHHAKDAYLNIVVGNVYNEKFTSNPLNYIKEYKNKEKYSLNQVFNYDVKRGDYLSWDCKKSMDTVEKMMNNNNVQVSRMTVKQKGGLYDATVYKAKICKEKSYFPLKKSDGVMVDVSKYGGYTKIKNAYYSVYKFVTDKDSIIRLIPVPIYISNSKKEVIDEYALNYAFKNKKVISFEQVYPKLYIGSLLKIDGFYYYLGGKTDDNILLSSAVELVLSDDLTEKIKNISTYLLKKKDNKELKADSYCLYKDVNITDEALVDIYKSLLDKKNLEFFKYKFMNKEDEFGSQETIDLFNKLDLTKKCNIIMEMLNTITDFKSTYNLKDIKINMYRPKKNMVISKYKEFKLINKSVTGLHKKEIDLLSL